jgi:hypothetical protein
MFLALLCSCDGSDNNNVDTEDTYPTDFSNVSSIIGTWKCYGEEIINGKVYNNEKSEANLTFNSDGTYEYHWYVYQTSGTYTFSNGLATCKYENNEETFKFEPYSQEYHRTKITHVSSSKETAIYLFCKQ